MKAINQYIHNVMQCTFMISTTVTVDTQVTSTFSEQVDALNTCTLTSMYKNLDQKAGDHNKRDHNKHAIQ